MFLCKELQYMRLLTGPSRINSSMYTLIKFRAATLVTNLFTTDYTPNIIMDYGHEKTDTTYNAQRTRRIHAINP